MERNFTQITIKPGIFSLAVAGTIGFILGQTTVYVKAAKAVINNNNDENSKN